MLVLPTGWAHATLNLEQSVGIAGEWSFGRPKPTTASTPPPPPHRRRRAAR